jgi:hypothetical protein
MFSQNSLPRFLKAAGQCFLFSPYISNTISVFSVLYLSGKVKENSRTLYLWKKTKLEIYHGKKRGRM